MSVHSNNFYSNVLKRPTHVEVVLPEPVGPNGQILSDYVSGHRLLPTVWLLHGLGGDATAWLRRTNVELLATQYRVAVVMPETERGFYTNMAAGPRYWDYLTRELPARMRYTFPLSSAPADNFVMGNSMGGYGALRWALTQPQAFAAVAALSPVTDLARFRSEQAALMPDFDLAFRPEQLTGTAVELQTLLNALPASSPLRILTTTGRRDILRSMDEAFNQRLVDQLPAERTEWHLLDGQHDWFLWNQELPFVMHWLIKGGWRNV